MSSPPVSTPAGTGAAESFTLPEMQAIARALGRPIEQAEHAEATMHREVDEETLSAFAKITSMIASVARTLAE